MPDGVMDADLSSIHSLRASLAPYKRAGTAAWMYLSGLGLDDPNTHSGLCHALVRFGFGGEQPDQTPTIVVLDWSTVDYCPAEGFAFFVVLVRWLASRQIRVIACEPASADVRGVLARSGIRAACADSVVWVPCPQVAGRRIESVTGVSLFAGDVNASLEAFCDELSAALPALGVARRTARALMGTTQELLQNVLSHAHATHAAAVAVLLPRRRPKVLQIGIADDGVGIPGTLLHQARYAWLDWFHDAGITQRVLERSLSGRIPASEGSGGGLARMIRRLLRETSSSLLLRTAAGLIVLRSDAPDHYERRALACGGGTQVRVEVRLGT